MVSTDGTVSYCRACVPATGFRRQLFPNPLPEVLAFRQTQGLSGTRLPWHNPACRLVRGSEDGAGAARAITSPLDHAEYVLDHQDKRQMLLS